MIIDKENNDTTYLSYIQPITDLAISQLKYFCWFSITAKRMISLRFGTNQIISTND